MHWPNCEINNTLWTWLHLFWTGWNGTAMDLTLCKAVERRPMCELMRINSWPLWWPSSVIEMYGHRLLHAYSSSPQTVPDRYTKASSVWSQSHWEHTTHIHPTHMLVHHTTHTHTQCRQHRAAAVTVHVFNGAYAHTHIHTHTGRKPTLSTLEPEPSFSHFPNCIIHTVPNEMIASSYCWLIISTHSFIKTLHWFSGLCRRENSRDILFAWLGHNNGTHPSMHYV